MNFQQRLILGINYEDLKKNKIKRLDKVINSLREIYQYIENVYLFILFIIYLYIDSIDNRLIIHLFYHWKSFFSVIPHH
jgi:hypothetical protein